MASSILCRLVLRSALKAHLFDVHFKIEIEITIFAGLADDKVSLYPGTQVKKYSCVPHLYAATAMPTDRLPMSRTQSLWAIIMALCLSLNFGQVLPTSTSPSAPTDRLPTSRAPLLRGLTQVAV